MKWGKLKRRYGRSKGRSEGVAVKREKGRIYFVDGKGDVRSVERKNA